MKYKKFLSNSKAISPIFATLILIAIAVIAGVVVYMFTSGTLATMTGGGTAAQEKVSVQAVQVAADGKSLLVYTQSQSGSVTITNALIKDSSGNVVNNAAVTNGVVTSALSPVTVTLSTTTGAGIVNTLLSANTYTVTLVSSKGGSFVSSSFAGTT